MYFVIYYTLASSTQRVIYISRRVFLPVERGFLRSESLTREGGGRMAAAPLAPLAKGAHVSS